MCRHVLFNWRQMLLIDLSTQTFQGSKSATKILSAHILHKNIVFSEICWWKYYRTTITSGRISKISYIIVSQPRKCCRLLQRDIETKMFKLIIQCSRIAENFTNHVESLQIIDGNCILFLGYECFSFECIVPWLSCYLLLWAFGNRGNNRPWHWTNSSSCMQIFHQSKVRHMNQLAASQHEPVKVRRYTEYHIKSIAIAYFVLSKQLRNELFYHHIK